MDIAANLAQAWEIRQDRVRAQGLEAFRLVFAEADGCPGLTVDDFGGHFFILLQDPRWKKIPWEPALRRLARSIHPDLTCRLFIAENYLQGGFRWLTEEQAAPIISEGELRFEIRLGESRHPGLFLDQRDNRGRVGAFSENQKVLNLFCHTGAFTIAALRGGAREVHSVDLSKNYLNWLERNLELNDLQDANSRIFSEDVFRFLERSRYRYDLIIVDPPSFSRGKKETFSTEKDLERLLEAAAKRLATGGKILASINTQKLGTREFSTRVKAAMKPFRLQIREHYGLPFDFAPSGKASDPYLKSCLIG